MVDCADLIEACAEALVLADLRDWQHLAGLQQRLLAIAEAAPSTALRTHARTTAAAVERLFDGEISNEALAVAGAKLTQAIEELRQLLAPPDPLAAGGARLALVEFLQRHQTGPDELAALLAAAGRGEPGCLDSFRRALHTLKGEAGMLRLDDLQRVCHAMEDAVQDPALLPVDSLLKAIDWIGLRLDLAGGRGEAGDLAAVELVQAWLHAGVAAAASRRDSGTGSFEPDVPDDAPIIESPLSPNRKPTTNRQRFDQSLAKGGQLPEEATPEMLGEFLNESHEHLERVEGLFIAMVPGSASADDLNAIFRSFHTIKGLSGFLNLTRVQVLAHAAEDMLDRLRSGGLQFDQRVLDLLFSALDTLKGLMVGLGQAMGSGGPTPDDPQLPALVLALRQAAKGSMPENFPTKRQPRTEATRPLRPAHAAQPLGEILIETGAVPAEVVRAALAQQQLLTPERRLGEILLDAGQISPAELGQALAEQRVDGEARPDTERGGPRSDALRPGVPGVVPATMRVDVERVDALNDAIGELVIAQNMLSCSAELSQLASRRVQSLLAQLDRVTRNIQDMAMRLRLVSIRPVFQRMVRLGRDAARKLGKEAEVITEGDEQELDKSVVDRLGDPLVHLVRNAVDHGLEADPAARAAAGKPACGKVTLRAYRTSGSFCVTVSDDGRGLDRARILAKARERNLVREGQHLTDEEVWALIFLPGFSTADKVTDVSGRGVGMDVVKRMVEEMRGQVVVESKAGAGTTITILLPLTLAIIDGMLVGVGDEQYILPTLSVITSTRPREDELGSMCGNSRLLTFQGHQIPVVTLRQVFGLGGELPPRPLVVVVEDGSRRVGLVVDAVLGRQQVVLKALGAGMPTVPGVGGATINGDGRVCLVLDVGGLLQLASTQEVA
ncbi:MAG: chemotaxis protein CheA [Planctomycetes bacterium]|nr:chemotaxis protein CheA [Planctomycetota bacterium]